MTTLTVELPPELVARLEQVAAEQGRPLDALVAAALPARFAPDAEPARHSAPTVGGRIRLRPVRLANWPAGTTFRREEIYGDDAR